MKYIDKLNEELKQYIMVLCGGDYPYFIDDYIYTKTLQSLDGKGQFCGQDYQNIQELKPKYWFSSLNHSISDASITWHLTHNKAQAIAGLLHDSGTSSFHHCTDFLMKDYIKQESSEKKLIHVLKADNELMKLLKRDNIRIEDVINLKQYTVVENEKPKLCADRLDGILHTGLIWNKYWSIDDIKRIYNDVVVLKNEENEDEIGIDSLETADFFNEGQFKYSIVLTQNENKLCLQLLSDILRLAIHYKVISLGDLYTLSENEIISRIMNCNHVDLREIWTFYTNISKIYRSDIYIRNKYCVSITAKKRRVNVLCRENESTNRITDISSRARQLRNNYKHYEDSKYAYVDYDGDALSEIKKLSLVHHNNL